LAAIVLLWSHAAQATDLHGTYNATQTITENSRLTGDVTCAVTGAPCIQFGAPGIELDLNGHIMTGNGSRSTCTFTFKEDGIFTNGKDGVSIKGPGIVRRFQQRGIEITGNDSVVKHVTVLSSCLEGILVGGHHNLVEESSVARASLATNLGPIFDASIWVQGTGGHVIRHNEISASGSLVFEGADKIVTLGGQGIFVGICGSDCTKSGGIPSTNNLIKENSSSGIPGSGLFFSLEAPPTTKSSRTSFWEI
jgi:Right handed beta helix region